MEVHSGHDPVLMALSVLIAIQGSFVSIVLAREVGRFEGARRRLILAISAVTLGSSIWAMHFIGMLAYHMPMAATYDLFLTLLSFLIAVLAVGIGYGVMTVAPDGPWRDIAAAIFTGGGIAGMHYVGMAALSGPIDIDYQLFWVGVSVLVGIIAAGISLHLGFGTRLQARAILGAIVMGLAISGMHYAAMVGTVITPTDLTAGATTHVLDRSLLAIVVAIVAFIICATSLLLLVPNRAKSLPAEEAELKKIAGAAMAGSSADGSPHDARQPWPMPNAAPHQTPGPSGPDSMTGVESVEAAGDAAGEATGQVRIPARVGNTTVLLDPSVICAIRADGRYTHLRVGSRDYFCNFSITDLAGRLDPQRFFRVHRSHLVQVRYVKSLRRKGDGAVIMVGERDEVTIPVSRSALPRLKARLGLPEHVAIDPQETVLLS